MSVAIETVTVRSDHAIPAEPPPEGGTLLVQSLAGGTLYYADSSSVSAGQNQGSLAPGQSATFLAAQWLRSADATDIRLTLTDVALTGGVTTFNGRPGAVTLTKPDVTGVGLGFSDLTLAPSGADDSARIQSAVNSGANLFLAKGTHQVQSFVSITNSLTMRGAGIADTIVQISDVTGSANGGGIEITGSKTGPYVFTADVNENDLSVSMSSGNAANFSTGDLIQIHDPSSTGACFVTRVSGVSGTTVSVEEEIPIYALVANAARAFRLSPVENVVISDLTIECAYSPSPQLSYLMIWLYHLNCSMSRVRFRYTGANPGPATTAGCAWRAGRAFTLMDCEAENIIGQNSFVSSNLVFEVNNTTAFAAIGNKARRISDGIALSGCPQSTLVGNRLYGRGDAIGRPYKLLNQSNYSTCVGNVGSGFDGATTTPNGTTGTGIHCLDSFRCVIQGNTIRNTNCAGIVVGATVFGATDRSHHCVVQGNNISFTGLGAQPAAAPLRAAVQVGSPGQGGDNTYHTISGNNCFDTDGIQIYTGRNHIVGNFIDANSHARCPFASIKVHADGGNPLGNVIASNSVRNAVGNAELDTSAGGGNTLIANDLGTGYAMPAVIDSMGLLSTQTTLTDGATVAVNASLGTQFFLSMTRATRTISSPTNPALGALITFELVNNSGGATVTTWDTKFKLAGAWADPASNARRTIQFRYNNTANAWVEVSRAPADIT